MQWTFTPENLVVFLNINCTNKNLQLMKFEIFTAVKMWIVAFWVMTLRK
jgi:hypothetical protein